MFRNATLGLLLVLVLVIVGCGFLKSGPDANSHNGALQSRSIEGIKEKTFDDLLVEVAKRAPGFGGMFIDEEGALSVYLLDVTQKATAEAAIAAVFGPDRIPPSGIRVLQGQYSFVQLKQWHDRLSPTVLARPGVILTDIDEAKNRLRVGVEKLELAKQVEEELTKLDIPRKAVLIEVTEPVKPLSG
ncbi:MAG: hypothetical protein HY314_11555 [Acidobacteria bacterium]|nr:hypothetical protein [Acidobacteriota bacterium]